MFAKYVLTLSGKRIYACGGFHTTIMSDQRIYGFGGFHTTMTVAFKTAGYVRSSFLLFTNTTN